ncbi:MAG: fimbria/pilus outer membrane usher protein [Hyphomonas oceanitis]|uniref:fimbria/pilus outer membrane usher protein n=1 Tax=Hyphomonas oceanitis TaxID=81033 RepID=UPI00300336B5
MVAASLSRTLGLRGFLSSTTDTFHIVETRLNGQVSPDPLMIVERDGIIWLPKAYLGQAGLKIPAGFEKVRGQDYVPVSAIGDAKVRFSPDHTRLDITCSTECYESNRLDLNSGAQPAYSAVTPGLFINYDLYSQFGDTGDSVAGFAETGLFTPWGTGLNDMFCISKPSNECIRLESNWTIDDPGSTRRLRLGDTVSDAGTWGIPVRFGGVRWGTDFSLSPDILTFPTPSLSGDATVPGTVSVLINATERFQGSLKPGPFTITDLPVVTGAGTAQAVVTDVLGRETIVTTQFYAAPQLLRPGLADYSLEAGWLREDFGLQSNHYSDPFLAGGYARGLTDTLTMGARAEISDDVYIAGLSATKSGTHFGVIETSAALSGSDGHTGSQFQLSHEYRSRSLTLGSTVTYASEAYKRIGEDGALPRTTARAFVGWNIDAIGAATLNWVKQDARTGKDYSAVGFGLNSRWKRASIAISALKATEPDDTFLASLRVSVPFGSDGTAASGLDYRNNNLGVEARFRRSAPRSGGLGYNIEMERDGIDRFAGGMVYRGAVGEASADVSDIEGRRAGRLGLRGGLAYFGSELVVAPAITDSMALVELNGEAGVRVYHDRQLAGVTDKRGRLVISDIRNHETNVVAFEPTDLPLTADFSKTEVTLVPGFRTGHRVEFGISHHADVIAHVVRPDGRPLETGTRLEDRVTGKSYVVGSDGRVFIPDADTLTHLTHESDTGTCVASLHGPAGQTNMAITDLGTITCQLVNQGAPA